MLVHMIFCMVANPHIIHHLKNNGMKTSFMLAFASQGFAVAFGYMFVGLCLVALVARWMWKNEEAKKSGNVRK